MGSLASRTLRSIRDDKPSVFAEKAARKVRLGITGLPVLDGLCLRQSARRLQAHGQRESEPSDVLDTVYGYRGLGRYRSIEPMHARANAAALLEEARSLEPDVIVEIGAGRGGSFYLWTRGIPSARLVLSVDTRFKTGRLLELVDTDAEIHLIEGSSHDPQVKERLEKFLDGRSIDLLYIDGDHTYEGAMQDFEMYSQLVGDGGIVMMDDIDNATSAPDVVRVWKEIAAEYETETVKRSEKSSAQGVVRV